MRSPVTFPPHGCWAVFWLEQPPAGAFRRGSRLHLHLNTCSSGKATTVCTGAAVMVRRCRAALKMVRAVPRQSGPGKANREGISIMQLTAMFPDEASATVWFEALVWPDGRHCPRCGCTDTRDAAATAGLPYYCVGFRAHRTTFCVGDHAACRCRHSTRTPFSSLRKARPMATTLRFPDRCSLP